MSMTMCSLARPAAPPTNPQRDSRHISGARFSRSMHCMHALTPMHCMHAHLSATSCVHLHSLALGDTSSHSRLCSPHAADTQTHNHSLTRTHPHHAHDGLCTHTRVCPHVSYTLPAPHLPHSSTPPPQAGSAGTHLVSYPHRHLIGHTCDVAAIASRCHHAFC